MPRSSKKLVLYSPKLHDERRGRTGSKHLLPLSVLTIAGLPDRDGYDVVIVDGNLYPEQESFARVLEACEGALLYGTTGILGHQVADGYRCTQRVKQRFPDLPAFIGGWFATAAPGLQLETGLYDAVAMGQGEITLLELVRAVECGASLESVAGLALWRDGQVVHTDPRAVVGWDQLVNAPWHLLDWEPYRRAQLQPGHRQAMEAIPPPPGLRGKPYTAISYFGSYGCPLPCTFCCSPEVTGRRWKAMPAERMLDDLAQLKGRWGFDIVHFYDANWGVSEERAHDFATGLIGRGLELEYFAYMQADSVLRYRPQTLDALAESGLYLAVIGAETGTDETMTRIGKTTRGDGNVRAALELDRRGVSLQASYLIGFPNEAEGSMLATLDQCRRMALACPFAAPMVWFYHPIPGAAMYHEALEQGFEPPRTLEQLGTFYDYRLDQLWPGRVPPRVRRMHKLYGHFTNLANGLARGRVGVWERSARRRLEDAAGFARGWPLGALEAKAFDLWWRIERRLRPRRADFERGWRAGAARARPRPTVEGRQRSRQATS